MDCTFTSRGSLVVRALSSSRFWDQIPARVWLDILKLGRHAVPLQIFNGQDNWPKGTPDSSVNGMGIEEQLLKLHLRFEIPQGSSKVTSGYSPSIKSTTST